MIIGSRPFSPSGSKNPRDPSFQILCRRWLAEAKGSESRCQGTKFNVWDLRCTQRAQYPFIKEYALNYIGLQIMI